jgi:hypothetical protein
MLRRVFTVLSALSLVLCVAATVLGLVSVALDEPTLAARRVATSRERAIRLAPGEIRVDRQRGGGSASHGYRLGPIALWSAALPFLWLADRLVAGRRPRFGRRKCQQCGYDLRATPGRCPECGAMPTAGGKA